MVQDPLLNLSVSELARREHTARRWALLYNEHERIILDAIQHDLGADRAEYIGRADLSVNLLAQVAEWVAVSYVEDPLVSRRDGDAEQAAEMARVCEDAGLWRVMRTVNRDTMALRECLVRVGYDDDGNIYARPAWPQRIYAEAWPDNPTRAREIREVVRMSVAGQMVDVIDVHRLSRADVEGRRVVIGTRQVYLGSDPLLLGDEVTAKTEVGDWWCFDAAGNAILPYAWYHARQPAGLWSPYEWRSISDGTVTLCVLRSYFTHTIRHAAWQQRYTIGLNIAGAAVDSSNNRSIVADPTTVLRFEPSDGAGSGTPGSANTFANPVDLNALMGSIRNWMQDTIASAGLPAADIVQTGADPRSGLSLAVSREAQREVQRQYVALFEAGDRGLLQIVAAANAAAGGPLVPDTQWVSSHRTLSLTTEERQRRAAYARDALEQRLIGRAEAYQLLHPGTPLDVAMAAVAALEPPRAEREPGVTVATTGDIMAGEVPALLAEGKTYEASNLARVAMEIKRSEAEIKQGGNDGN